MKKEVSFSKEFIKHYKVTHHVDLERLLQACSILLTNFTGPETEDNPKNHLERLFNHFMLQTGILCEEDMKSALVVFGEVLKIPKKNKISMDHYQEAAQIIGDYFKVWNYNTDIDNFFLPKQ